MLVACLHRTPGCDSFPARWELRSPPSCSGGCSHRRQEGNGWHIRNILIRFYEELLRGMTGKNTIRRYVDILTSATPTLAKPPSSVPWPGTCSWSAPSLTASAALDDPPFICYHFDRCRTIGTVDGRRHPDARTRGQHQALAVPHETNDDALGVPPPT